MAEVNGEQSTTPEPWAPEGADRAGKSPRGGEGGERGSSAFDGDGASDKRGALPGVEYFEGDPGLLENSTGARTHKLESTNGTEQ